MSNNNSYNDPQNSILDDSEIDNSTHVVLRNIASTDDVLRRRTRKVTSPVSVSKQQRSQTPPKSPKRIPQWLWIIVAKSLGIKTTPNEKPYLSSILHLITLGSAGCKLFIFVVLHLI